MEARAGTWVLPTSMLLGTFAWSFVYVSLPFHYLVLAGLGLAVIPLVARLNRRARPWDGGGERT